MAFLEFRDVKKRFGKKEILSGVSFDINENEIFGLVGLSGGGKTTLLNILVGISKASEGKIFFRGASYGVSYYPDFGDCSVGWRSWNPRLVHVIAEI
jgi:ABC-type multidrug transport system ATPase subunit